MPVTVGVNFLSVVHASSNGITMAFPDVCKTPTPAGPTTITRSGDTLTCTATWTVAPDTVEFRWRRRVRGKTHYEFVTVARTATYTPTQPGLYDCEALGSNAGGRATAPPSSIRA